ncbi:DUF3006 domain-containing protein [Bacillus sp. FJAT-45350]|uniref:DUF3006 domain-containing protein n=1 Tax=Bacillus sp. FJAT-45350 TaxID=2011014 RepID=UPI000BB7CDB9|nr:DUF3006 domain-containing protein [Bacillus sp. FJAT-45350]
MANYTVDRIEETIAILLLREDEMIQKEVPLKELPSEIKEGDMVDISFRDNGTISKPVIILENNTKQAKKKADALLQKILSKNKK